MNSLLCSVPWIYLFLHDSGFPPTPKPKLEYCRPGGGSFSVAMSVQCKKHKCFVLRRTRGKSMFSNEAASLRFDLNSGPSSLC